MSKFSPEEEQLIREGVTLELKKIRSREIAEEISRRVANASDEMRNNCRLTIEDVRRAAMA